ncbi:Crp/Fnr family transcriptional regulator [Streptomyces sp. WI04-05B]|uniref:Crp/Fnr family transcriptional regulator n=1 Tax=Streptomyces TaxID=1883 RepID=UPI0029B4007B|nr:MULTISPECIES: Crp/Fnr family transcriptional regulator [unclassified Streptomyces]MDX2543202.1 Crp/Fnr family transcriptional regulator [Streptomyces sp. WI04-05B]MDX2584757.1 Crp/Fnr family transcriptional regulator [Streptomyces sp. WI04-05A]MDX3752736.1 Crp/Fnr family transcriptional regulator [Streptomyces sp. AK08-02]
MRHKTFWETLAVDEREAMERVGRVPRKPFEPGDTIFRQSDEADRAAVIINGRCRVLWHGENERTTYLASRRDGELIGEMGLLDHGPRNATVTALTRTYIRWYGREVFEGLLLEHPGILRKLSMTVCTRLKESDHHRIVIASAPARLRLGRLLLSLAEAEGVNTPLGVEIREVTQENLGDWLGTGREAAGRRVRELQARGFLADSPSRSRIVVTDPEGLRRHAFGAEPMTFPLKTVPLQPPPRDAPTPTGPAPHVRPLPGSPSEPGPTCGPEAEQTRES